MKLSHFLGRKDCCESISTGCHSVRRHEVWKYGSKPLNPLTGPFQRHLFIMVQIGAVAFRRDGLISIADPDDALLIDSGEGEIEFFESDSCVKATILEFDERAIADLLRSSPIMESIAADAGAFRAPGVVVPNFRRQLGPGEHLAKDGYRHVFGQLFLEFNRGVPEFTRARFYAPRWKLLCLFEKNVWFQDGLKRIEAVYGAKKLRRNSPIFAGAQAQHVLSRRRYELATGFLQSGHSISEVAKALGFSSSWHLECAYSGYTKRRCRDVQKDLSLRDADPERLLMAIVPWWWRERTPGIELSPPVGRLFQDDIMSLEDERDWIDEAATRGEFPVADWRAKRDAEVKAIRELAQPFLEMKSTAANAVIPMFQNESFANPLAA